MSIETQSMLYLLQHERKEILNIYNKKELLKKVKNRIQILRNEKKENIINAGMVKYAKRLLYLLWDFYIATSEDFIVIYIVL